MRGLNQFNKFDWDSFSTGKKFVVTQVGDYIDYNTKEKLGTKVDVVIFSDNTPYVYKDGNIFTNRFEKLSFKCSKDLNIPLESIVIPKGVVATVYGEYRNQLSIKCENVEIVQPQKKTGGTNA